MKREKKLREVAAKAVYDASFPEETPVYKLGDVVASEDLYNEYKASQSQSWKSLKRLVHSVVPQCLSSFLNSSFEEYFLWLGVNTQNHVRGFWLTQAKQDQLRRLICSSVVSCITPFVEPSSYTIDFKLVETPDDLKMEDHRLYIIKILIRGQEPNSCKDFFRCNGKTWVSGHGKKINLNQKQLDELCNRRKLMPSFVSNRSMNHNTESDTNVVAEVVAEVVDEDVVIAEVVDVDVVTAEVDGDVIVNTDVVVAEVVETEG